MSGDAFGSDVKKFAHSHSTLLGGRRLPLDIGHGLCRGYVRQGAPHVCLRYTYASAYKPSGGVRSASACIASRSRTQHQARLCGLERIKRLRHLSLGRDAVEPGLPCVRPKRSGYQVSVIWVSAAVLFFKSLFYMCLSNYRGLVAAVKARRIKRLQA